MEILPDTVQVLSTKLLSLNDALQTKNTPIPKTNEQKVITKRLMHLCLIVKYKISENASRLAKIIYTLRLKICLAKKMPSPSETKL